MTQKACHFCHGDGWVVTEDSYGIAHADRCKCNPKAVPVVAKQSAKKESASKRKNKPYREKESWRTK